MSASTTRCALVALVAADAVAPLLRGRRRIRRQPVERPVWRWPTINSILVAVTLVDLRAQYAPLRAGAKRSRFRLVADARERVVAAAYSPAAAGPS